MNEERRTYLLAGQAVAAPPLEPGLYLVATPIGNLRDITIRALETLAGADVLACEDTRITRRLLERYGIARRPHAYHEHNSEEAGARLLAALGEGKSVALVSDAGTPLISDPGYRLVTAVRAAGHRVWSIPGASAILAALPASGLATDAFRFCGFLPAKAKARDDRLAALARDEATLVFYEAPGRLAGTLDAIARIMGPERPVSVARELTKLHEEIATGPAGTVAARFGAGTVRGEIVVMIAPAEPAGETADPDALLRELLARMPAAKAAREAAALTGLPRADLYQRLIAMKRPDDDA